MRLKMRKSDIYDRNKRARHYLPKAFLSFFFILGIIVLSKVKLHPIFGLGSNFSLVGPFIAVIPYFIGAGLGSLTLIIARMIQFAIGISKAKSFLSYIVFLPAYFAGVQFRALIKKKRKLTVLIPLVSVILFLSHPIGRQVWYFALYWTIPIIISLSQPVLLRISRKYDIPTKYLYSLSATFVDHAIGSVIYLYALNIPAIYWKMAIPYVLPERLIFAVLILMFYLFIDYSLKSLEKVVPVIIVEREIVAVKEEALLEEAVVKN